MGSHDEPDSGVLQRLTRIETRLARFMVALGVNPHGEAQRAKTQRIRVRDDFRLVVPSLETSLLDLRQFLTANSLAPGTYTVLHDGVVVATITLPD